MVHPLNHSIDLIFSESSTEFSNLSHTRNYQRDRSDTQCGISHDTEMQHLASKESKNCQSSPGKTVITAQLRKQTALPEHGRALHHDFPWLYVNKTGTHGDGMNR